jgi:hypothetical protein
MSMSAAALGRRSRQHRRGRVAQHSFRATGEDRGQPVSAEDRHPVADGVDAVMHTMQAAAGDAMVDRAVAETQRAELAA